MIRLVSGHICSGKSWHVRNNAKPGDVVIDMDRIALALSCENTKHHEYPTHIAEVARATRWAAIEKAVALHRHSSFDLWIIHAYPTDFDMARYRRIQAAVVEMKETPEVLMERARAERPPRMVEELRRRIAGTD